MTPDCDVSVIIPFSDDEETVGVLARRIAAHLRRLGLSFELLACDEESGDESGFVLSLVARELPELRLIEAPRGEGFAAGARVARGRTVWLIEPTRPDVPLAPFQWAHDRVLSGAADIVPVETCYLVCRRTRAWRALEARGRGDAFARRLFLRATLRGLRIELPAGRSRLSLLLR